MNRNIVLSNKKSTVALEMINIQNNSFGKDIEKHVEEIVTLYKNKLVDKDEKNVNKIKSSLVKLFKKRLGLKISFIKKSAGGPAYIILNPLTSSHIFLKDRWREDSEIEKELQKALDKTSTNKGYVDTKKAMVGGFFSEIENKLFIDFEDFSEALTIGEITAVILHELGHAFTYLEYSDRIESTNQIMLSTLLRIHGKGEKNTYVFKELSQLDKGLKQKDVDELLSKDKTIMSLRLFRIYNNNIKSTLSEKYDETTSEALADNFASKFGYGKDLITALDKFHKRYLIFGERVSIFGLIPRIALQLYLTFNIIVVIRLIFSVNFFYASCSLFLTLVSCFNAGDNNRDMTYDDLVIRYKRIREEELTRLKEGDLSKEEIKSIIETIEIMDEVLKPIYHYKNFYSIMGNFLFNTNRGVKNNIAEQRVVEELQKNDLLLSMNKLKIKTKE